MFNENILFAILIVLIFTTFVNFIKKKKGVNLEMQETANKMIRTYNGFVGLILLAVLLIGLTDGSLIEYFGNSDLNWTQIFLLISSTITFLAIFYLQRYKSKKECEYKNDERWHAIVARVNKNLYHYNDLLIALTALAMIVPFLFTDASTWYVNYERVTTIIFFILSSRNIIELIQLHVYDSKI